MSDENKEITDFSKYKRFPIELSHHTFMLIHLFYDSDKSLRNAMEMQKLSVNHIGANKYDREYNPANQFYKQMEGEYSTYFVENMIYESVRILLEGFNKEVDTVTAKRVLDKAYSLIPAERKVLVEKKGVD